jgi:hypothetical protein
MNITFSPPQQNRFDDQALFLVVTPAPSPVCPRVFQPKNGLPLPLNPYKSIE